MEKHLLLQERRLFMPAAEEEVANLGLLPCRETEGRAEVELEA
jgi:hypothetical protein